MQKRIDEIEPYERNPRNNDEAVSYVAQSIKDFGWKVPIVIDANGVIVCGHTRYKAAKQLGLSDVPCIVADDLTDEQIKAYRLADNKVAEHATWDESLLAIELGGIADFDMGFYGFELPEELENMEDEPEERPEVEFTEVLEEEHNYLVLYFETDVDWLQAQTLFDVRPVKNLPTNKKGEARNPRVGTGRVLNGAKALSRLVDWGVADED